MSYQGEIGGRPATVSVFDHPSSFRHPTTWHARAYGLFAANPFGWREFSRDCNKDGSWTVSGGEKITFKYRVLIADGKQSSQELGQRVFRVRRHKVMSRRRWLIAGTLCLSTILNYINRQTFSMLAPELAKTFHFSHADLSSIFGAFQLSYALTWLVGGFALDLIGTRTGLAVAVVWWSVVGMATSLAHSVASFAILRFLIRHGRRCQLAGRQQSRGGVVPAARTRHSSSNI